MEDIITLRNIDYSYYGKIAALKNISFSVKRGEIFSVIGLNGSGKSTLLHIINALLFPDTGDLFFEGNAVTEKSLKEKSLNLRFRQRIGYIFQNSDIQLFCPTVFDELLFGPLQINISLDSARERAEQTLSYLGIGYLKDRPVYMLSGGEKKRVAIASVLTMNPDVLLVDEPLSNLDPKTQTFFIELLLELNRAGKTIIFTTHQLDLIDHLQPRVAVLSDDHTIRKTGTASEILGDEALLIDVNLIHEHIHKHGGEEHKHYHSHYVFHRH
jgi:cobalt/nickel transport system ATP-binding protein